MLLAVVPNLRECIYPKDYKKLEMQMEEVYLRIVPLESLFGSAGSNSTASIELPDSLISIGQDAFSGAMTSANTYSDCDSRTSILYWLKQALLKHLQLQ